MIKKDFCIILESALLHFEDMKEEKIYSLFPEKEDLVLKGVKLSQHFKECDNSNV